MTTEEKVPDLAPCPWCGYPAEDKRACIQCPNCWAQGPVCSPDYAPNRNEDWNRVARPSATGEPGVTREPPAGARSHDLKVWPEFFAAIRDNRKPFEMRINDRDYRVGDWLKLNEWAPDEGYSGRCEFREVGCIVTSGQVPGLRDNYCILGFRRSVPAPVASGERVRQTLEQLVAHVMPGTTDGHVRWAIGCALDSLSRREGGGDHREVKPGEECAGCGYVARKAGDEQVGS